MGSDGRTNTLKDWVESKRASIQPPPMTDPDPEGDPNLVGIPKIGEEILAGKYVIERVMGIGGMGVVCAAMHKQLKQRVAIKFLAATMRSPELVDRFVREGQAAVRIKSEHIAPVLDVGVTESGAPYLMMEHLSGADLSEYLIERGRLPVQDAVDFVLQALDALAVAHSAGVVHRDLKPSNLFVTQRSDGSPLIKVLDFGISKVIESGPNPSMTLTRPGMMLGSPRYMSPEQLRNASGVDHRADIWAMGVVLHELIAGTPPYDADTFTGLCAMIVSDPPTSLCAVVPAAPPELEAIILRCMAKVTADRWQDVGELAQALGPFASDDARPTANRVSKILGKVPTKTPPGGYTSTKLSAGTPKPSERTVPLAVEPALPPPPSSSPLATTGERISRAPSTDPQVGALAISTVKPPAARSPTRSIAIGAAIGIVGLLAFIATRKPSDSVTGGAPTATTTLAPIALTPPSAAPIAAPAALARTAEPVVSASPAPSASTLVPTAGIGAARPRPVGLTATKPPAAPSAAPPTPTAPSEEDMLNRRR